MIDNDNRSHSKILHSPSEGSEDTRNDIIAGRNAVAEALKKGRPIDSVYILKGAGNGSLGKIVSLAKENGIPLKDTTQQKLDSFAPGINHQGVVAVGACHSFSELEDIFNKAEDHPPFILIADSIEDPHNLGALIRTAEAAGAHGVIIPKRHGVGLTATVAKTSAGAIEYMPVVRVSNLVSTIEELKKKGLWIFCADMDGNPWCTADLSGPIAIVVGAEGAGVSRLTREHCDGILSLPMNGQINSLNASVAAGIVLYEVARQRGGLIARQPKA